MSAVQGFLIKNTFKVKDNEDLQLYKSIFGEEVFHCMNNDNRRKAFFLMLRKYQKDAIGTTYVIPQAEEVLLSMLTTPKNTVKMIKKFLEEEESIYPCLNSFSQEILELHDDCLTPCSKFLDALNEYRFLCIHQKSPKRHYKVMLSYASKILFDVHRGFYIGGRIFDDFITDYGQHKQGEALEELETLPEICLEPYECTEEFLEVIQLAELGERKDSKQLNDLVYHYFQFCVNLHKHKLSKEQLEDVLSHFTAEDNLSQTITRCVKECNSSPKLLEKSLSTVLDAYLTQLK
jgi:hypothetical protein